MIKEIKPAYTLVPMVNYDLKLAVEVLRVLKIPFGMVINRAGIGDRKVYEYCENEGIQILLEIPHDMRIARYYSEGVPFVKAMPEWKERFAGIIDSIYLQTTGLGNSQIIILQLQGLVIQRSWCSGSKVNSTKGEMQK